MAGQPPFRLHAGETVVMRGELRDRDAGRHCMPWCCPTLFHSRVARIAGHAQQVSSLVAVIPKRFGSAGCA